MDKYEYKVRADEIKELIARGEYVQATQIADTIDWRRVKSVMMLCTISDLYKINRRYEDARDMLLLAYERRPGGRTICYSLCELSIKMEEYVQAVEYYKEFVQIAPKDPGRYILQYKLYEAQEVSLEERIEVLEELKKKDYREKWAYELAYLYHRVGLATRCVEECDEIILWFGEGKYVIKAMELKMLHEPLTPTQQEQYDHRLDQKFLATDAEENTESVSQAADNGMEQAEPSNEQLVSDTDNIYASNEGEREQNAPVAVSNTEAVSNHDDMDIQVKTMDVGQYNTINLQEELAEGLREILGEQTNEAEIANPVTRSIVSPMLSSETEALSASKLGGTDAEQLEPEREEMEGSEVFFGETGEIGSVEASQQISEVILPDESEEDSGIQEDAIENTLSNTQQLTEWTGGAATVPDITAEIVMSQLREESLENQNKEKEVLQAEPPKELAEVLAQESDGQIGMVVPEGESLDRQITGQMNIEDILTEWERMKKQNEEKRKEEVRQHVLQQTGNMFTEFEAAVRDGLLEQLEGGRVSEEADPEVLEETEAEPEVLEETEAEPDSQEEDEVEELEEIDDGEQPEQENIVEATEEQATEEQATEEQTTEEQATEEQATEEQATEEQENIVETTEEETEEEAEEKSEEKTTEGSRPALNTMQIEQDKASVRALTREERELYAPFIQSRSARERLVKALDNISLAAYTGNVIITGEEGMDTLTLAKNMIREVQMTDSNFSGKVAKISGQAINQKEVPAILQQLKNGALIVQKASQMNHKTANALYKALQKETLGIIIVLVDTKKSINKFFTAAKQLESCFSARMDVEALSNDTLVAFGRGYARELEFAIDEFGILALHTRIENMQTSDHVVTVVDVKEIIDEAIHHAKRKTLGHFFDILFAKRYDDEDMIILTEKDFI